jgi:hypothetical protein
MRLLGMFLLAAALLGCSSSPARLSDSAVPADFTLEVRDSTGDGELFIIEPDRWFRAATGARPDGYFYPPATRLLTPEQMAAVWAAVQASGVLENRGRLTEPTQMDQVVSISPVRIDVQVNHKRTILGVDPAADSRAAALLDELRQLAWITPQP